MTAAAGIKLGPKSARNLDPIDLSLAPNRGYRRLSWFAENYLTIPSGYGQGKPFKLKPWQRNDILKPLFPARNRPSQGLVAMPRGNGKSSLAAVICLYALFADEVDSPQVLIVASDLRQAGIIYNMARRMIELNEELASRCKIYKDRIEVPGNNGVLMPLPGESGALQGWQPTLAIVDELHTVTADIWEAMLLSSGKRPDSLVLAISTPSLKSESVMWDLVTYGRAGTDPDFFFKEYTSDTSHPTDCEHCIKLANPAYGTFLNKKSMDSVRRTSTESAYRAFRLGQWLSLLDEHWLSRTQVEAVTTDSTIPLGSKVVLAVDGSYSGDATAIVAVTVAKKPRAQLLAVWEPHREADGYRVPIADVEDAIRKACATYNVVEVLFDPYRFSRTMEALAAERLPIVEFPQSAARMTPATVGAYSAIDNEALEIVSHEVLTRHLLNAHVTEDARGTRIRKRNKDSKDKIDAAVCLVMALSRATHLFNKKSGRVYRSTN